MPDSDESFDAAVRVRHVRWAAEDGSFAVLSVEAPDGDDVTVAGPVAHLSEGDRARVVGRWTEHDRYGIRSRPRRPTSSTPTTRLAHSST